MLGERTPTLLQPCSLFPSLYHHIDKPYGITISLPPYSNMLVVLTYLKSTYVFDYLQHLSTTYFLISMFHLHHNLQQNCQFDSRPLEVKNRLDLLVFMWRARYLLKALDKGYNFALDLISIEGLHKKLWASKVAEVPILRILGFPT